MLDDTAAVDTQGFQVVYVFPYPERILKGAKPSDLPVQQVPKRTLAACFLL